MPAAATDRPVMVDRPPKLAGLLAGMAAAGAPRRTGRVVSVSGLGSEITGLALPVGGVVRCGGGLAEVVSAGAGSLRCMALESTARLQVGDDAVAAPGSGLVGIGSGLLGRVLDGLGRPIDGKGPLAGTVQVDSHQAPPGALERSRIREQLSTGVRAIDAFTPLGRGQRMGLFAGSGVGKSSLLSMVARGSEAALSVIALVGERGREVREFLEDDLGPEGLARSVVVVATSDQPALMRLRAARTATRIAEHFRDGGADVVLMMDSLTRVAMAQREIGLTSGEPPATRGYPPSVFPLLAGLLERTGPAPVGSITALYTVLVEGDDHNEPVADTVRSIVDGHIVLDRTLAVSGHYPAIDVLGSVSRLESRIAAPPVRAAVTAVRRVMAARAQARDLIDVGAYKAGANPLVDAALRHEADLDAFLRQGMDDPVPAAVSGQGIQELAAKLEAGA